MKIKRQGTSQAIVLIKAAPVIGSKHGETVCCAGIDIYGNWLRLYPVSFRVLDQSKRFSRWDKISFNWRKPDDDNRIESRRINDQTLEIIGNLPKSERSRFLAEKIVYSLDREFEAKRSLALLKPEVIDFIVKRKSTSEIESSQARIDLYHSQSDLFVPKPMLPRRACPYEFKYGYRTEDGIREGTCQDWETEATFFYWRKAYGEEQAVEKIRVQFGETLPARGLCFAMGTHSRWPDTWLINGLIQISNTEQSSLF